MNAYTCCLVILILPELFFFKKKKKSDNIFPEGHFREIFRATRKFMVEKLGSAKPWESES